VVLLSNLTHAPTSKSISPVCKEELDGIVKYSLFAAENEAAPLELTPALGLRLTDEPVVVPELESVALPEAVEIPELIL